jgi:hypothetical protein
MAVQVKSGMHLLQTSFSCPPYEQVSTRKVQENQTRGLAAFLVWVPLSSSEAFATSVSFPSD